MFIQTEIEKAEEKMKTSVKNKKKINKHDVLFIGTV